jgi:GNAT superfamily N-acetyltransferase
LAIRVQEQTRATSDDSLRQPSTPARPSQAAGPAVVRHDVALQAVSGHARANGGASGQTELRRHRVEMLSERHLSAASEALRASFADTIWSDMGTPFLRCVLGSFVRQATGVAYVYLCGGDVVGLVVGADDAGRHRNDLLRQRWHSLARHGLWRLATGPTVLARVLTYARPYFESVVRRVAGKTDRSRRSGATGAETIPAASLMLLCVVASHRGQGVGEELTRVFLDELARRQVARVKLVVGSENGPALKVYRGTGWREAGEFPKPEGGSAYRLVFDFEEVRRRVALARH